ncbi:glycoside hydrolase family 13 protein [Agromyces intestinalis]|uniref:Glycoside hydrolase family 13 protein n=1 Tax=Agromyces intestinalis TaxID=2592652 RepID=A0A5C1YM35_9MICO|nr:glycoside hydrolase family 13 protein [Agromyces intestinalis]
MRWWQDAVVYQVYIRSFADGDGDGEGDLAGLIERIDYLADLGVDAIWLNPWYRSPMADGGYDVADYRDIDPRFGTLADAERLIDVAHGRGLRVIIDIVPNHTSDQHRWFRDALAGDPAARARYLFRPGRGVDGELPPNDWVSAFGGSAWARETKADGTPGDWYLHLYAVEQPDLDWSNREVREEFEDVLRFWFDRGVDGVRIDVAHGLVKADGLPDGGPVDPARQYVRPHPAWDQPGVHEIYRAWRRIADGYEPDRIFVAEAWVPDNESLARYLRPDELHTAFQIDLLFAPWSAAVLRETIAGSLAAAREVGAPSTWVLSNHDVPRNVTRYARTQPDHQILPDWDRRRWAHEPADLSLGMRRARAAAMLVGALPGSLYVYQGEELGLPEYEDLPHERRQDPTWWQSGYTEPGRDGCRVPLPWARAGASLGFGPEGGRDPWLPQPAEWGTLSVDAQAGDPDSTLELYRSVIRSRRDLFGDAPLHWIEAGADVLAFERGGTECRVNLGRLAVPLPRGSVVLLASGPVQDVIPPDTAVYLSRAGEW